MPSRMQRLFSRAITPTLGNLKPNGGASSGGGPRAATKSITYSSPGQPQPRDLDAIAFGEQAYLGNVYVMRCVQTIANTIAGLEWRAGMDPTDPAVQDPDAPLAQLLGPSTPGAPGGPFPGASSRAFWAWTICQYIVYGSFGWETQLKQKQIVALWPLVSACLSPIATLGGSRMFDGYQYQTPMSQVNLTLDQCVYAWRPSLQDWRKAESVLSAAKLPIFIASGLDRYMQKLLQNDMVATTLVVSPIFDETSARRAWQEQFLSQFSGIDNKGTTIFAEVEADEDETSGKPLIQVEKIGQTAVESSMIQISTQAKIDITIALGVPVSLIGNASQRTYANADSEYKNFWTITILPLITELQDHVNTFLSPRIGSEVGWFDLSKVAALQPPPMFMPPAIGDVIATGVANAAQIANVLGIPAADATADSDSDTVEVGEESSQTGPGGSRSVRRLGPVTAQQLMAAHARYRSAPRNSYTYKREFGDDLGKWLQREHIEVRTPTSTPQARTNEQAIGLLRTAAQVQAQRKMQEAAKLAEGTRQAAQDIRAIATASRTAKAVHDKLAEHYPESVLGWVNDADWSGPTDVDLSTVKMDRRPGGRDMTKVRGIAKGIAAGAAGAVAPVILVKTPDGSLKVADGYHRTLARKHLGRKSAPAYVGEVDTDEGPWDTEMHEKKLNRSDEPGIDTRTPTSPGPDWHNSDGLSPHGTKDQLIHHLAEVHKFAGIDLDDSRGELDNAHAADHSMNGECGAHERQLQTVTLDERTPITVFDGHDFEGWFAENGDALEGAVSDGG